MKTGENELKSLNELKLIVVDLGRLIKARKSDLPTIGKSADFAHPSVDVDADGYHYVVVERGVEIRRESTNDLDQLLFWIFEDVSFSMAIRKIGAANAGNRDQRRAYFVRQVELLNKLKPEWGEAILQKQTDILEKFPFDDFARSRARYSKQLRDRGLSNEEAWQAACEKYPLKEVE
jgi:Immunity protein 63